MTLEIITIIVSSLIVGSIYIARIKSKNGKTFLFSENFLQTTDEKIFEFVKFVFKLYALLFANISVFISKIPHQVVNYVHKTSHYVAQKSKLWIDKIAHKTKK
jgi:hypothetical protein